MKSETFRVMGALSRLTVVVLIVFAGVADRAAAQQVVAGALPGPTLDVLDAKQEGRDTLELTLDGARHGETDGRLEEFTRGDPPLWPNQAIVFATSKEVSEEADDVRSAAR